MIWGEKLDDRQMFAAACEMVRNQQIIALK